MGKSKRYKMQNRLITKLRMRMARYVEHISLEKVTYFELMQLKTSALLNMCALDLQEKEPTLYLKLSDQNTGKHQKYKYLKDFFDGKSLYVGLVPVKKQNEYFYKSTQWLTVRYEALLKANGCCECCGARAKKTTPLHVDHIKPRSRYPELQYNLDNLQVLCKQCNFGKGAVDETDWRQPGGNAPAQIH